jgi:serine/threonine protein kinase/ketosteroid isomerase-like protein
MTDKIGPYEILGELGRGAMAVVWRAWDPNLDREIALKEPIVSPTAKGPSAEQLATRFVREGKAAARLNHPGIVAIHSANVFDGRPVIVMELIEGRTLSEVLAGGPLQPDVVNSILDQLLDAVGYAHSKGIVHRDIKPDNVFVLNDGRVKLADFGIAQLDSGGTMTQAGAIMGTPGYMSPEQVMGNPVDGRTDLYAIGVLGWEMLAGRNPFGADAGVTPTAVMFRVVQELPADIASVVPSAPDTLMQTIRVAMAKDPAQRFPSADAMRQALRGGEIVVGGAPVSGATTPPAVPAWNATRPVPPQSGQPSWMPYAIVGAIGVVAIVVLFIFAGGGATSGASSGGASVASSKPSISVTSPSPGSAVTVGTPVNLTAGVAGAPTGAKVVFMVNGAVVGSADSAPYSVSYNPAATGQLNVSAKLTLADGTEVSSDPIAVTGQAADSGSSTAPETPTTGNAEADVRQAIADWKSAWEAMDLNTYLGFYDTGFQAYKPKYRDYANWVNWKRGVFAGYLWQKVTISDLSVDAKGNVAHVTFHQVFESDSRSSSTNYHDSGMKTMRWELHGGRWLISQEDWVSD